MDALAHELLLHKCHPPSHPSQDAPMHPLPSSSYQRLGHTIAERMCPIDQPLMLMASLGRRSHAPAQHVTESG